MNVLYQYESYRIEGSFRSPGGQVRMVKRYDSYRPDTNVSSQYVSYCHDYVIRFVLLRYEPYYGNTNHTISFSKTTADLLFIINTLLTLEEPILGDLLLVEVNNLHVFSISFSGCIPEGVVRKECNRLLIKVVQEDEFRVSIKCPPRVFTDDWIPTEPIGRNCLEPLAFYDDVGRS